MNWNSSEFIWLDWLVLATGVIAIVWAVYRSIKKDKEKMQGADSQDYLSERENLGTLLVRLFLQRTSVPSILLVWLAQELKTV